ncbi:hypothetical protein AM1_B0390 (plasmid) [Acaryochloris marina MBIC11017]|uniref:Uncharacterized protein n=1 Tax=Acaryochloris marina (strain MBIC 11017) TaxID=329726 RepID=A8ZLT1_ACAM1|nr:hypothetical protein AM1_B0390 [Acaryochloris marina MBIC11017]
MSKMLKSYFNSFKYFILKYMQILASMRKEKMEKYNADT